MSKEDPVVIEGAYNVLEHKILAEGKPYISGTLLKVTAGSSRLICKVCGVLPSETRDVIEDWLHLCHLAMQHVQETGHKVAVERWTGAIYGPE